MVGMMASMGFDVELFRIRPLFVAGKGGGSIGDALFAGFDGFAGFDLLGIGT